MKSTSTLNGIEPIDIQIGEGGLYDWYKEESFVMVNGFEQRFEFHRKRKLTPLETRALYDFFRQQLINILPPSDLQNALLPFVMQSFSESELIEINAFLKSASGKKLAATQQAMQAFIKVTTSESYPARFTKERAMIFRKAFDAQFQELSIPWAK
ncbi:MAG: DUF2059 domain-containing protein [Betaproteobacteria bacterium]|nr:DUF2059 domain-containing protein [Betaproteobacteria bacterium]